MKENSERQNFLLQTIDSMYIIYLFPILIIIGKIVRWIMMYDTLISYSKGWGYINTILNTKITISFFEMEDVLTGSFGSDNNMYLMYKGLRALCLNIPDNFYEFEIVITLLWGFVLFLMFTYIKKRVNVIEFLYLFLGVMVISVYSLSLAKEPMQMLYFYLLFLVIYSERIPDNWKLIWGSGVIFFSAATFRVYYLLIIGFAVAVMTFLYFLREDQKEGELSTFNILGIYVKLVGVYFILMQFLQIFMNTLYLRLADSILYASDATESANTYIENVVTDSTNNVVLVALEYSMVVIRLLFPLELLSLGVKYWPYIIYQLCMTTLMLRTLRNYNTNTKMQNVALIFFLGFVFASATFEVDFGAWIRHGAVVMPLVLLLAGIVNRDYIEVEN